MNEQIELRHSPYTEEWQPVGRVDQAVIESVFPSSNRAEVPVEELGQFTSIPIVVFEMN